MKSVVSSILLTLLVGTAMAFFRPQEPYQVEVEKPTVAALFSRGGGETHDPLSNPDIADDQNISPSRKCGFCMGVSEKMNGQMNGALASDSRRI